MNRIVSVIIPIYNTEKRLLQKCIKSVMEQTYEKIEIILVDDGSNTVTAKFVDEFLGNKRIKVIHQANGGLCKARNTGVKEAIGEWICFVDSDDYLDKNIIKSVMNNKKTDKADVVCFGTIKEYKHTAYRYSYEGIKDNTFYDCDEKMVELLLNFDSNIGDVTSKIYRKKIIDDYRIEHDEAVRQGVEAIDFNIRFLKKANKFLLIKKYGYYYSYNEKSITLRCNQDDLNYLLIGINKLYDDIKEYEGCARVENILDARVKVVVVATVISGIAASNQCKREKRSEIRQLIDDRNVKKAIKNNKATIDYKRDIILFLIKHKMMLALTMLSRIRSSQKRRRA